MKVAALQLCASDDPVANIARTLSMVQQAAESGAQFIAGQAVEWYREHDQVWMGITPEGTRSKVDYWKSGFMRIAHEAEVPIMLVGVDATRKEMIVDKTIRTTGDHETQVEELRQYMNDKFIGINPKNQ